MTASATIVADRRDDALSVPLAAVRSVDGKSVVSVVVGEGNERRIEERVVETGLRAGDRIEIRGGLAEGEQIVIP
jgi:multidrug efflux pump subunit AcrA (membrane-fusion protein)